MVKVASDIGAVAKAWEATVSLIRKIFETSETRKLKAAARKAKSYINRAERISPDVFDDRACRKLKKDFLDLII